MSCTPRIVCQGWLLVGNQFGNVISGMKRLGIFMPILQRWGISLPACQENFLSYPISPEILEHTCKNHLWIKSTLKICNFCLASAFPWAISWKLWRNFCFLLGPFLWIMYVFILFHICLSSLPTIARPLILVHSHGDIMAVFILWLSKGNGHFQGLWKEITRYPLAWISGVLDRH